VTTRQTEGDEKFL